MQTLDQKLKFENDDKEKLKKLNYLCQNYDPYQKISKETSELLQEFGIDPQTTNPFHVTNKLLILLDQLTQKFQKPREYKSEIGA